MSDQRVRVGIVLVAIALLVIGVVTNSWWTLGEMGVGVRIGLRKIAVCIMGTCIEGSHSHVGGAGTAFRVFANFTYFGGLIAAAGLTVGAFLRETQADEKLARSAGTACALIAISSVFTVMSFPEVPELEMPFGASVGLSLSYGFYFTLIGGILGAVAGWAGALESMWKGKEYIPVARAVSGADAVGSAPRAAFTPTTGAPADVAGAPAFTPRTGLASAVRNPKRASQRQSDVALAATDTLRGSLRFVARTCEINPMGMSAVLESGQQRDVLWSDVGVIVARMLPPDPPFEKITFVDIVPAPFPGRPPSPIRLLPSTRANYGVLPGGAGMSSKENFRKLAALVQQSKPDVLDADSASFFTQGAAAPMFASVRQFADYDAQFVE